MTQEFRHSNDLIVARTCLAIEASELLQSHVTFLHGRCDGGTRQHLFDIFEEVFPQDFEEEKEAKDQQEDVYVGSQ